MWNKKVVSGRVTVAWHLYTLFLPSILWYLAKNKLNMYIIHHTLMKFILIQILFEEVDTV